MATQKEESKAILISALNTEFDIIRFYLDNIDNLNYKMNKKELDELILGSIKHASLISKTLMQLGEKSSKKLDKEILNLALKEELGAREIYQFEFNNAKDPEIKKCLGTLIKEEAAHEAIVVKLKG